MRLCHRTVVKIEGLGSEGRVICRSSGVGVGPSPGVVPILAQVHDHAAFVAQNPLFRYVKSCSCYIRVGLSPSNMKHGQARRGVGLVIS
jgi:hypothetical protein